ncbi:MAG: hypothetical protein AAF206_11350 [Bacteroidota bacterium]
MCWQLAAQNAHHYMYANRDRETIHTKAFLKTEQLEGALVKYTWRQLEKAPGEYDFHLIEEDLSFLMSKGKKLFIQLQDVSFDTAIVNVPDYLRQNPVYKGGLAIQYMFANDQDKIKRQDGWVPRRWEPAFAERFHLLVRKLGAAFDGRIEGIILPETSIDFGTTGKYFPDGYSPESYRDAILANMGVLKSAFPKSAKIQYTNFMPGEWLPWDDKGYLKSLYTYAAEHQIGMGGPDIKVWKKAQMNHSYGLLNQHGKDLVVGMAIQWGNYEEKNPFKSECNYSPLPVFTCSQFRISSPATRRN